MDGCAIEAEIAAEALADRAAASAGVFVLLLVSELEVEVITEVA